MKGIAVRENRWARFAAERNTKLSNTYRVAFLYSGRIDVARISQFVCDFVQSVAVQNINRQQIFAKEFLVRTARVDLTCSLDIIYALFYVDIQQMFCAPNEQA
jgi:hypothetical protein